MVLLSPSPAEYVLEATGLRYEIPGRRLLDGADLRVAAGQSVAVTGPSGSGKSTLLMCLLGLQQLKSGRIEISGRDITAMRSGQLARHRRDSIGMVFQFAELLPELPPLENVALAALLAGQNRKVAFTRAEDLLDELGVGAAARDTATADLSGGERQRVAVARALINEPALLVGDEPTGALDEGNRDSVASLLFSLPQRWSCGLLIVTHDHSIAERADHHLVLRQGTLQAAEREGSSL
ncbi:ABC transporter ATP-binding protein [Streptomyces sp. H27-D2]|uniref:ABC transporter ATP-binding protein n=1 Tax=Streptomyces sp. H27-D2 TaxID=3046304 RepID=UPI002DBFE890|nr:ATP-binding cassette domain-containing protein [Streptomyces sp. H27-D2]MEC4019409.1 ATP-binding cassette domain-containing protein [Streptomyces sp. H27-D2]